MRSKRPRTKASDPGSKSTSVRGQSGNAPCCSRCSWRSLKLRRKAGDPPNHREYLERFETYTELILTMLGDLMPNKEIRAGPLPATKPRAEFTPPLHLGRTVLVPPDQPYRPADPVSQTIPERIGRYQVIREVGQGNFVVYQARDDHDGHDVAIKVARPDDPTGGLKLMSLADEAKKLKVLNHPRIVKLFEYVPAGGTGVGANGYIVLEYVEGQILEELLHADPVPVLRLIRIVALVADAVHHTHTSGVVHRDLKPSNILLDLRGEPHVGDFGLAIDEEVQRLRGVRSREPFRTWRPSRSGERPTTLTAAPTSGL